MKARKARLDPNKDSKPRTRIVAKLLPGVKNFPHNVLAYELEGIRDLISKGLFPPTPKD